MSHPVPASTPRPLQPSERDPLKEFAGYDTIAIIANSEALDLDAVKRRFSGRTLFVFFTHCNKVLSGRFDRDAILCHRMRSLTVSMATDDQRDRARALFEAGSLKAEIGIYVSLTTGEASSAGSVGFAVVDLDAMFTDFYTMGQRPSSGFALALWLGDRLPRSEVVLCGFTGVRGEEFKTSPVHDWTLEQTVLRILYRDGRLIRFEGLATLSGSLATISRAFPQFSDAEVAFVAADVLNNRMTGLERLAESLRSVGDIPLRVGDWLKQRRLSRAR